MTSFIIHGENTRASRQKLYEIRNSFDSSLVSNVSLEDGISPENQMFIQPLVAVFEFFEKDQLRKIDAEKLFDDIKRNGRDLTVILWFGFELTSSNRVLAESRKNSFAELKFAISPVVFKLADYFFSPKSSKNIFYALLSDFGRVKGDEVFLIQMLIRNARLKIWAAFKNNSFRGLAGFSKKQAESGNHLTQKKLLNIFAELVSLERKIKIGPADLVSNILLLYEAI
jgi:hypothetical protein